MIRFSSGQHRENLNKAGNMKMTSEEEFRGMIGEGMVDNGGGEGE